MNPIDALFERLRGQGQKAFIPFLAAGDPDPAGTVELARTLAQNGANLLELGFPYSDPIADGPVIQASYTRALGRGLRLKDVFGCARTIAEQPEFASGQVPLVGMVSYSIVQRQGLENFVDEAKASGFSGLIVPDLPAEESGPLREAVLQRELRLIQLVTPTTPRPRAADLAQKSSGFLYCVSITGITGVREQLPETLLEQLTWLREQTNLPLCVGFGVSRPEQVRMLRAVADGIIVGSALVRHLEQPGRPLAEVARGMAELTRSLVTALNP